MQKYTNGTYALSHISWQLAYTTSDNHCHTSKVTRFTPYLFSASILSSSFVMSCYISACTRQRLLHLTSCTIHHARKSSSALHSREIVPVLRTRPRLDNIQHHSPCPIKVGLWHGTHLSCACRCLSSHIYSKNAEATILTALAAALQMGMNWRDFWRRLL